MKQIVFSAIQPSGDLHIGNLIGAIRQWVKMQKEQKDNEYIFSVVDLHAITVKQDPAVLKEKILEVVAIYLASGLDEKKSRIFVQSENPDHANLAWIFDCVTPFSWLKKMTQFKDKSLKQKENTTVGLFNYPALMAADILLYDTDVVPVGEDQQQHIELTRNIAERFNKRFGEVFKLPKGLIDKTTARIMSLQDPLRKMSKSDANESSRVNLLDDKDVIVKKIMRAVTDSDTKVLYDREKKPAISNLLAIFSSLSGRSVQDIEREYVGQGYGKFKKDLAEVVVNALLPIQERYNKLIKDKDYLKKVLNDGKEYVYKKSSSKMKQVKEAMGLGVRL